MKWRIVPLSKTAARLQPPDDQWRECWTTGRTLEVNRVCVNGEHRNANSALYGAIGRAAMSRSGVGSGGCDPYCAPPLTRVRYPPEMTSRRSRAPEAPAVSAAAASPCAV